MVVQQGEESIIAVTVDQINGLLAASIEINFEPEIISIESVSKGAIVKNFLFANNVPEPGRLLVSLVSARAVSGEGDFLYLRIKVKEDANDGEICPLEFTKVNINGENIGTVKNGKLYVGHIISIKKSLKKAMVWGKLKKK